MEVFPDWKELFGLLNSRKVECIIVGSYALAFHGAPRATGDIEIYVRPDRDNARRILEVLKDFGFSSLDLAESDFLSPGQIIQLGNPPARVDFLTPISGVTWDQAYSGKAAGRYGDVPVYYLGLAEYKANIRVSGRMKDLADLEALGEE